MSAKERVPVLIVGAGGAGLSLSLLLRQQGLQPCWSSSVRRVVVSAGA